MSHVHGGDTASFIENHGRAPLDFSVNLNPLGIAPGVLDACHRALDDPPGYPDPDCRALVAALAGAHRVPARHVVVGNGAADLIYRYAFALRPKKALVPAPTFHEYEAALEAADCTISHAPLDEARGFALGDDFINAITPDIDVVFLCNPNNPTGRLTGRARMRQVVERCAQMNARLVVDECFIAFVDRPDEASVRGMVEDNPQLFVLDAFTKSHALAGVRLGYGLSADDALLNRMAALSQPWAVSSVAQAGGLAALGAPDHVERARRMIAAERETLSAALIRLGLTVYPSSANYLLFRSSDPALGEKLAKRGMLIRDARNFRGLSPGHYRVAIKRPAQNARLINALEEILWQSQS